MDAVTVRALHQIARDITGDDGHALNLADLTFVARGKVFTVYQSTMSDGTQVGVRIVPEHWLESGLDDDPAAIPPRGIVLQETLLTTHCAAHGVPAPRILGRSLHGDEATPGLDLIVYAWCEDDGHWVDHRNLGRLVHQIHDLNPPAFTPVRQTSAFHITIAHRIIDQLAVLQRRSGANLPTPSLNDLKVHLAWPDRRTSLLHMGLKHGNVLAVGGEVTGVMGWCDALIGPPTFELLSLDERGLLDDDLLGTYSDYKMLHPPAETETAFRLAESVRIANDLTERAPRDAATKRAFNRVRHLAEQLCG